MKLLFLNLWQKVAKFIYDPNSEYNKHIREHFKHFKPYVPTNTYKVFIDGYEYIKKEDL